MKKTKSKLLSFLLIAGLLLSVMAPLLEVQTAQAATYTGATTYNGHTYCIFPTSMSWSEAKVYCEKVGGHLATITSAKEQAFIEQLNSSSKRLWIGAYRDEYFLWYWVTGETWDYMNWGEGEPNDLGGESYGAVWPKKWNDLGNDSGEQSGLICEWDYELEGADSFDKVIATYKSQANVFDGHSYFIIDSRKSWDEAKSFCELIGGHLATITSADEQKFIDYLNKGSKSLWIGAYRDEYFLWYWVTGEKWDYTNWKEGEPNNQGTETCVAVWPSEWNDLGAGSSEQTGFICEWDTATNTKYAFTKQKQTITGLQNFSKTYKAGKLNKKSYTVKLAGTAENKLTYSKVSGSSKIKVSAAGKITIPKNLKKGTYVVKVKATAAGSKFYKKTAKTVTVKIIVK